MKSHRRTCPLKKPVKAKKKTAKGAPKAKPAAKKTKKAVAKKPAAKKKTAKPLRASPARKAKAKAVSAKKAVRKTIKVKAAKKAVRRKPVAKPRKTVAKAKPVAVKKSKAQKRAKPQGVSIAQVQIASPPHPPLVAAVIQQLEDSKAEHIVTIDLVNRSSVADTMIVATGRSDRHVNAISDQVVDTLLKNGQKNPRVEGKPQCDWVLVDSGDVIVHIFRPEVRSFYNLEKLWSMNAPKDNPV